jgi:hypothetical protein
VFGRELAHGQRQGLAFNEVIPWHSGQQPIGLRVNSTVVPRPDPIAAKSSGLMYAA